MTSAAEDPRIQKVIQTARKNLEKYGDLSTACFLGIGSGTEARLFPVVVQDCDQNPKSKELFVKTIRKLANEKQADWVLALAEAWSLSGQDLKEGDKLSSSIANHPKRIEVVYFTLETYTDSYLAMVPIVRANKKATFGDVKWTKDAAVGLFSNLLPKRVAQQ